MKKFVMGLLIGIMLTLGITTYAAPEIQSAIFSDIKLIIKAPSRGFFIYQNTSRS